MIVVIEELRARRVEDLERIDRFPQGIGEQEPPPPPRLSMARRWWRRRESNPRPKTSLRETLQV